MYPLAVDDRTFEIDAPYDWNDKMARLIQNQRHRQQIYQENTEHTMHEDSPQIYTQIAAPFGNVVGGRL